jgi:hypothetical protein
MRLHNHAACETETLAAGDAGDAGSGGGAMGVVDQEARTHLCNPPWPHWLT